jgi:hypothetical protein
MESFTHGGSPEELCLPLVAIGLYHLLAYLKNIYPKPMPYRWVLINGIIAGCVLWIKFSLLGFWFGWMLSVFIILLINNGFVRATKAAIVFLSGMLIATVPWVVYFGLNHSITEWINSYFMINLTSYSTSTSVFSTIKSVIIGVLYSLRFNPFGFGLLYFGLIVALIYKNLFDEIIPKLSLMACFAFLAMSVYGGGRLYIYYMLIFSPFLVFGFIVIFNIIYEKFGVIKSKKKILIIVLATFVTTFSYTLAFHHNTYMLEIEKGDLVQYKFASIINQTEDPTLLNYGVLDLGFYTAADIVPNVRFFQNQSIPYSKFPIVMDEQNRYIKERLIDYVVMQIPVSIYDEEVDVPCLNENYQLIEKKIQSNESKDFYYLLFKKK